MFGKINGRSIFALPEKIKEVLIHGAVVQLVRIHACHAWGRGFESRPHRQIKPRLRGFLVYHTGGLAFPIYIGIVRASRKKAGRHRSKKYRGISSAG